ncbi:MAG TPA: lytic transglycosylase domain-containing protein, partial [Gammaproteobacteria bacterium]
MAHGEAGGRRERSAFTRIPLRVRAGLALLLGAAFAVPVHAAALYECNGSQGETVFTSHPSEYHGC